MTPDLEATADAERERAIFSKLRSIDDNERQSHAQKGILARAVRDQMLWKHREDPDTKKPCKSWTRWLRIACPFCYSTVHKALADVEELRDIPEEDLTQIATGNFPTLIQLSTAVRADPEVLDAAKNKRPEQFNEHIRQHHPDQHIESRQPMKFSPESSAAKVINEALEAAMERGARSRDEALEMIAVNFIDDCRMEAEVESAHQTT